MADQPSEVACPKCGELCSFTPRPDTQHWGAIRCSQHGFLWIPKPAEAKNARRKVNPNLMDRFSPELRNFCWNCHRHRDHLKQLSPSVALQVHHVIEVKDGGTDATEYLQLLCAECHSEVHRRREAFRRYQN